MAKTLKALEMSDGKRGREADIAGVAERLDEISERLDGIHLGDKRASDSVAITLSDLVHQVQRLNSLITTMPTENRVLRRLFFPSIFRRENDVLDPTSDTFKWILDSIEPQVPSLALGEDRGGDVVVSAKLEAVALEPESLELDSEELRRRRDTSRTLVEFLRGEGATYLICGKAGCGKSTFMKYIAHRPEIEDVLRT